MPSTKTTDAKRYNDEWRRLLRSYAWRKLSERIRRERPLCERCLKARPPKLVPSAVVHHTARARDNVAVFFDGPFEALCKPCHDSLAQQQEAKGYHTAVGADGLPIDPAHPFNRT